MWKKQEAEIKTLKAVLKTLMQECQELIRCFSQLVDLWRKEIKRMTKGLAEKNLDEIEAAQKIIQLAQEKQQKDQD